MEILKDAGIRLGDPGMTSPLVQPLPPLEGAEAAAALVDIELSEDVGKQEEEQREEERADSASRSEGEAVLEASDGGDDGGGDGENEDVFYSVASDEQGPNSVETILS